MKQLLSYVLFGGSLVVAYQAYENARLRPDTEHLARMTACTVDAACIVATEHPREERSGPMGRRYQWRTTVGSVLVKCERRYIFFGAWACEAERGTFGAF
ncbi:MAG: hypothetical protein V3V08_03620 [Nannocystaceae bacterium]